MWACPSYSECDSEIAFPLDAGCKRQGIKLKFELKGIYKLRNIEIPEKKNACNICGREILKYRRKRST